MPLIRDEDCLAYLPASPGLFTHPQDHADSLSIGLMSSSDYYVPSPRNLGVRSYLLILVKIQTRIISLSHDAKTKRTHMTEYERLYRLEAIAGSLRDWYAAIPDKLRNVHQELSGDGPKFNPQETWFNVFVMFLYHCVKIYLHKRSLFANVRENVTMAASSSAAKEIFLAGCDIALLLQGFLKYNPNFLHAPPFIASCIFGAALMVLIVSKLNLNPNDIVLSNLHVQTFLTALNQYSSLYNIGTGQKALFEHLQSCQDPVLLVMALSSLKNLKGDIVPQAGSESLLAGDNGEDNDQIEDFHNSPPRIPSSRAFAESSLLESVAEMANPYSDLMVGMPLKEDAMFEQMFNFS
jgi:hypothetical protein